MQFCLALIFFTTVPVLAEHWCSRSKTSVRCELYSTVTKDGKPCHRCPEGCRSLKCEEICSPFCFNHTCDYVKGSLQCSLGCIPKLTGKVCQEGCPDTCSRCHQFTSECCPEGFGGPYCNSSLTTSSRPTSHRTTSTTSSIGYPTSSPTKHPWSTQRKVKTNARTKVLKTTSTASEYTIYNETSVVKQGEPDESGFSIGLILLIAGIVGLVIVLALIGFKVSSHCREVKRAEAKKATYHKYDSIGNQLDVASSMA